MPLTLLQMCRTLNYLFKDKHEQMASWSHWRALCLVLVDNEFGARPHLQALDTLRNALARFRAHVSPGSIVRLLYRHLSAQEMSLAGASMPHARAAAIEPSYQTGPLENETVRSLTEVFFHIFKYSESSRNATRLKTCSKRMRKAK